MMATKRWKKIDDNLLEGGGVGWFHHSICRILIYILTTITIILSLTIVINHFSHPSSSNSPSTLTGSISSLHLHSHRHSHYHDLNKEEYELLYNHAKRIIAKHRNDLQKQTNNNNPDSVKGTATDAEGGKAVEAEEEEDAVEVEGLGQDSPSSSDSLGKLPQRINNGGGGRAEEQSYPSTPRDLVLGIAENIDPKNFAVFCKSLRSVSVAHAFIFVNEPIDIRLRRIADPLQIRIIPYNKEQLSSYLQKYHPSSLRWILFGDYFKKKDKYLIIYKRVFLLDVRDSYFQRDPFEFINPEYTNLHIFNGVETMTIQQCGWNGGWVKSCFGESMLQKIGKNKIICSGVTAGTMDIIHEYILLMKGILSGGRSFTGSSRKEFMEITNHATMYFPQCERNGVDQGVHNVIFYNHYLEKLFESSTAKEGEEDGNSQQQKQRQQLEHRKEDMIHQWSQRDTPVCNMQAKVCQIRINTPEKIEVINTKQQLVHVVHQYDRFPDLQKALFSRYVDWVDTNNPDSEWKAEEACQSFVPQKDMDMFKGVCDLSRKGGATSAVSCCKLCLEIDGCKGFTFVNGQCFFKNCYEAKGKQFPLPGALSASKKRG